MSALLYELEPSVAFVLPQNNNDLNSVVNEAFAYKDDVWDISPFLKNPKNYSHNDKIMNFNDIPLSVRNLIKQHCYYELGRIKPQSVAHKLFKGKKKLLTFMDEFEIQTLESFDTERFLQYLAWLRSTYITQPELTRDSLLRQGKNKEAKKYKPVSEKLLYHTSLFFKQLLANAANLKWDGGTKEAIYLDPSLAFIWNQNKLGIAKKKEKMEERVIPNSIWKNIINSAKKEKQYQFINARGKRKKYQIIHKIGNTKEIKSINFTKYIILIQAFTGLRISEVTTLKSGCAFQDKKQRKWLRRETSKTVLEPQEGDIRIPTEVYEAILEVDTLSKPYRQQSGLKNLFFSVSRINNVITPLASKNWGIAYLIPFMKRNNICDENGDIYKIRSHDFRHTFASKLVNEYNVPLSVLTRHYGHLSMEMTMHYVHLSKEKLLKKSVEGFTQASKILANGEVGENFIKVVSEAQVEDDIEALIEKLTRSFGVTSLPFGLCLYDYRRGHCPNLGVQSCWEIGCSSFVTSDKFLPNFEHEADILESQIARDTTLGKVVEAKKKKIKYNKIVKIIGRFTA